jgi:post-segregation antitoxin (ccd killing protein)
MPKVSVYLPEELYREVKERRLPLSALTQEAIERSLDIERNREWVAAVRARPRRANVQTSMEELMDAVRGEFGE